MNSLKFIGLSSSAKKKVVKSAVRGANEDQKALVERYKRETRSNDRVCAKR